MVLYNNFKWCLCFLVLFITNTWIHLNSSCQDDGTVGFLALLWSLLVHFFPKKVYLAWWQCMQAVPSWEELGGWRFKNFKFVQCPLQQWDHSEPWGCWDKIRVNRNIFEVSKQGECQTAFQLLIPWNSPGCSAGGSSHLLWSSNLSVCFGSSDNLNNTHCLFLPHTPILRVQDRGVNWTQELIRI